MNHNLTPIQRNMSKEVLREAFERIPETCQNVREILNEVQESIMQDLEIDPSDSAIVDRILSYAFGRIKVEVTQPFRDEQVKLLEKSSNFSLS